MNSPEGFMSQQSFEREFWYNPLFRDLYIPFANVRTIKHNGKITTKDKKFYMMRSNDHEFWHKIFYQIKTALPATTDKQEKMYDKFIEVMTPPKESIYLELYRRGSVHVFNRTLVPGSVELDKAGLRFIPRTQLPAEFKHKVLFENVYWYNPLMTDLFIPFSNIKSFKGKTYFRMKDGTKYTLF